MNDFVKPVKKKHALNVGKISLSAPNPQVKGVYATLKWDIFQNNPRIVVDTKDPNLLSKENGFGRITAAFSTMDFFSVLELIKKAVSGGKEEKWKVECLGHEWVNGQKNTEITPTASVWVGRDADGHIFISVVNEARKAFPIIKFIFGATDQRYVRFLNSDGAPMTKAQGSQLYAMACVNLLTELIPNILDTHYYEAPPGNWGGNKGGGGGGGNWNNNRGGGGYNGGGGQRQAPAGDIADVDLPF